MLPGTYEYADVTGIEIGPSDPVAVSVPDCAPVALVDTVITALPAGASGPKVDDERVNGEPIARVMPQPLLSADTLSKVMVALWLSPMSSVAG